jgi:hypothetical protein
MPPISPPLAGAECLEMQGQTEGGSSARRAKRQVNQESLSFVIFSLFFANRVLQNNQLWIPMLLVMKDQQQVEMMKMLQR